MRGKDCSLGGGVRVFCPWSETDIIAAPIGAEDLTIPLRLSISIIYILKPYRSL